MSPTAAAAGGTPRAARPRVFRIAVNTSPMQLPVTFVPPQASANSAFAEPDSPLTPVATPPAESPTSSDGSDSCPILAVSDAAWDGTCVQDGDDSPQAEASTPPSDGAADAQQTRSPVKWAPAFASAATRSSLCSGGSADAVVGAAGLPGTAAVAVTGPRAFLARAAMSTPSLKQRQLAKLRQWQNTVRQQSRMHQLCSVPCAPELCTRRRYTVCRVCGACLAGVRSKPAAARATSCWRQWRQAHCHWCERPA